MNTNDIERLKELVIAARRKRYLNDYRQEFYSLEDKEYPRDKYRTEANYKKALTYKQNRLECLRVLIEVLESGVPDKDGNLTYYSPHCIGNTIPLLPDEWREVITTLMHEGDMMDENLPDVVH